MDMLNILKSFDNAASGKKPSVGSENKNDMKTILESFNRIEECGMTEMPVTGAGQPVTMSITASGKENVDELMAILKGAGMDTAHIDMPMAHDAMHTDIDSHDAEMDVMRSAIMPAEEVEEDEWDNAPEEEYKDHHYMTKDLSGGINRQKPRKAIRVKDPAIESIRQSLWSALQEKKAAVEGKYKSDAQRKAIHANKMKKK